MRTFGKLTDTDARQANLDQWLQDLLARCDEKSRVDHMIKLVQP